MRKLDVFFNQNLQKLTNKFWKILENKHKKKNKIEEIKST